MKKESLHIKLINKMEINLHKFKRNKHKPYNNKTKLETKLKNNLNYVQSKRNMEDDKN